MGGDFNVAPEDKDVYNPSQLEGTVCFHRDERAKFRRLSGTGFIDAFRACHPHRQQFSWWDYRGGDFHQGRGMRIDLLMCSQSVIERANWCVVDRNARKGKSPSDHAPVMVDID